MCVPLKYLLNFSLVTGIFPDDPKTVKVTTVYKGVFIELVRAFNTVDHAILLRKLELYRITDRNNAWIKSYLSNRLQMLLHSGYNKNNLHSS